MAVKWTVKKRYPRLKRDIDQFGKWAMHKQIILNLDKCKMVHFGWAKSRAGLHRKALEGIIEERWSLRCDFIELYKITRGINKVSFIFQRLGSQKQEDIHLW